MLILSKLSFGFDSACILKNQNLLQGESEQICYQLFQYYLFLILQKDGYEIEMDNDQRPIGFFGIEFGDTILVKY